jgi:hypothetical protein
MCGNMQLPMKVSYVVVTTKFSTNTYRKWQHIGDSRMVCCEQTQGWQLIRRSQGACTHESVNRFFVLACSNAGRSMGSVVSDLPSEKTNTAVQARSLSREPLYVCPLVLAELWVGYGRSLGRLSCPKCETASWHPNALARHAALKMRRAI